MSYRGGPTNSESYLSFISATVLPRPVLGLAPSPCSVRSLANSSKDRSKPPWYVSRQHLAGLSSDNLGGVDRTPRDEDERPGQRTDLTLAD